MQPGETLLDTRDKEGRGIWVGLAENGKLGIELKDANNQHVNAFSAEGSIVAGQMNHAVVNVDSASHVITLIVNGVISGDNPRMNFKQYDRAFGSAKGSQKRFLGMASDELKDPSKRSFSGEIQNLRIYNRYLTTSEAISNYRAGLLPDIPRPISRIWDPSVPFPSSAEAPLLEGVTFHIIKPYEPEVDGYKWLHGATIARHKGTWFMTWGHNKGKGNTLGEVAQGRRSTDDFATLTTVEMIAPGTPTDANSHGVTLSLKGELWGFFGLSKGRGKDNRAEAFKLNETTDQWESQGVVMDKGFWPYTEPKRMENGNYITAGFRMKVENGSPPAVAISKGEDMTDWTVVSIPKPAGLEKMWGESAVIIRGKHLLCIARNSTGEDENWAYVSVSKDYGLTWTPLERSNMPMAASKPYAGTLSNGCDYLIATTTADAGEKRVPLTIALTDPGGGQFNRVYRITDGIRPGETSTREPAVAYAYAVEHDGSLCVVYSVRRRGSDNHNRLELAVIPIESLTIPE